MFKYSVVFLSLMIIIFLFSWIEFIQLTDKIISKKKNTIIGFFTRFIIFCYLIFFFGIIVSIYIKVYPAFNLNLIFVLLICITSDIGGYIFGKTFKGKKLTKISPNKTYSGALGSFVLSLVIAVIFNSKFILSDLSTIIFLTILISLMCQFGDLFLSYLKRKAKVKDTGNVLPGHGGILDRIDGILFALPFGLILIENFII